MEAKQVLNDVIQSVKDSNLNFSMNLTPFSAYITIRSSFTKNYSPPAFPQDVSQSNDKLEADDHFLNEKNNELVQQIKNLDHTTKTSTNTIKILEEKISKSEASALKSFEEKSQEISCLKKALKFKDSELACLQKEIKLVNKTLKENEREEYRLGQKIENLSESFQRCKSEISTLKSENKKLQKKKSSKSSKSVNVSTNTLPTTQLNSTCQPVSTNSMNPIISSSTQSTISSNFSPPVTKKSSTLANTTSSYCLPTTSPTVTVPITLNNNTLPALVSAPATPLLDNLTWPPLTSISSPRALNYKKSPILFLDEGNSKTCTELSKSSTIYTSSPTNNMVTCVDNQSTNPSKHDKDLEDEFRKQQEKWQRLLEEQDKKREEIFKKIFERLDAEETELNVSN